MNTWCRVFNKGTVGLMLAMALLVAFSGMCRARETFEAKLADLAPGGRSRLVGINDSLTIKVSIPGRWDATSARLRLRYTHSLALLPDQSLILVSMDGLPLAQELLAAPTGQGELAVDIPAELLQAGYHDLTIEAVHRSTNECQDPEAPELWTVLDMEASSLAMDHALNPLPQGLERGAAMLFDPRQPLGVDLLVVLEDTSPELLQAAALAVSAAAMRLEYRPLRVTLAENVDRSRDCLLIGSPEFVAAKLACSGRNLPTGDVALFFGPEIVLDNATRHLDDEHGLLVITGQTREELAMAAMGLALSPALPDPPQADVDEIVVPETSRYAGRNMLAPGNEYSFQDLGFATITFQGLAPLPRAMGFRLPSDVFFRDNQELNLVLDLSYGSGMREDSVLNVAVNGVFAAAVGFGGQQGGRYSAFVMPLSARLFRPGANVIEFTPVLAPLEGGACEFLQTGNLRLTLDQHSLLRVPKADHWTSMPRLELFFQDGFPLAAMPDWSQATVVLADDSLHTAATALNLVAMVSQANGHAPLGIHFSQGNESLEGDILLVGARHALPESLLQGFPLAPDNAPVRWSSPSGGESIALAPQSMFFLAEYASPLGPGHTVLAATASDPEVLLQGGLALWDAGLRSQCAGALTGFDPQAPDQSLRVVEQESYYLGSVSGMGWVDRFVQANPVLGAALLLGAGLVLAWALFRLLRSRKRTRG